jgi:hypothetical protein
MLVGQHLRRMAARDVLLDVARAGPRREEVAAVAPASTWLATIGWRRAGLLGLEASPRQPS